MFHYSKIGFLGKKRLESAMWVEESVVIVDNRNVVPKFRTYFYSQLHVSALKFPKNGLVCLFRLAE
jgi:hypothetical protein